MAILTEGLREGDLIDLVLPLITIDEYESKIDETAIVVGFFVKDIEPAKDLNRFIQKSAVSLLDTDVSPAPNSQGYYMVFVEFLRNEDFIKKIFMLIDNIRDLVGIKTWTFKAYKIDGVHDLNEKNLKKYIRLVKVIKDE